MKNIKQLAEFSNWIDNTINSVIVEKQESKDERSVERQRDITYLARQKYPDYPAAQAIELYLADKLTDIEQRDADQNRIINLQRRENQQLKTGLGALRQELDDVEASGKNVDAEIERLKQLSGKIQTDVEQRRASTREVDELLAQVEQLKNKPGVTPDQYKEMRDRVEKFEKEKVNPEELKKFQGSLEQLSAKDALDKSDIARLQTQLQDVEAKIGAQKAPDLSGISGKIQDIINRQEEIEKENQASTERVKDLEQRLQSARDVKGADLSRATELLQNLEQTRDEILRKQNELESGEKDFQNRVEQELEQQKREQQKYRKAVRARSLQAKTKINALLGPAKDAQEIKNLGDNLRLISKDAAILDRFVNDGRIDQYADDLSGLDSLSDNDKILNTRVTNMRKELKDIKDRIQILRDPEWEKQAEIQASSPSRQNPSHLIGQPRSDKEISETTIRDNKMTDKKINEDLSPIDTERIHNIAKKYLRINQVKFQYYIDDISEEYILEKIRNVMFTVVNKYGFDALFDIIDDKLLVNIIDKQIQYDIKHELIPKQSKMNVNVNNSPSNNIFREYEKNLNDIIGEQVSKWL